MKLFPSSPALEMKGFDLRLLPNTSMRKGRQRAHESREGHLSPGLSISYACMFTSGRFHSSTPNLVPESQRMPPFPLPQLVQESTDTWSLYLTIGLWPILESRVQEVLL